MRFKQLLTDDDAVSPVIGVILMVAITVILAAVIATFVLGLGEQVSQTTPNANFDVEAENATVDDFGSNDKNETVVTFTHTSGPEIEADRLSVSTPDIQNTSTFGDVNATIPDPVSAGENIEVKAWNTTNVEGGEIIFAEGDSVTLIWENEGDSATLREFELSNPVGVDS